MHVCCTERPREVDRGIQPALAAERPCLAAVLRLSLPRRIIRYRLWHSTGDESRRFSLSSNKAYKSINTIRVRSWKDVIKDTK
jgi:hypothetical protein